MVPWQSRAPSPTLTSVSGITAYHSTDTDHSNATGSTAPSSVPYVPDSWKFSKIQYNGLRKYVMHLSDYNSPNSQHWNIPNAKLANLLENAISENKFNRSSDYADKLYGKAPISTNTRGMDLVTLPMAVPFITFTMEKEDVTAPASRTEYQACKCDCQLKMQELQADLAHLRARCAKLEQENNNLKQEVQYEKAGRSQDRHDLDNRNKTLSAKNAELIGTNELNMATIQSLELDVKDYQKKYDHALLALEDLKVTNLGTKTGEIFSDTEELVLVTKSKPEASDVHMQQFETAIAKVLSSSRNNQTKRAMIFAKDVANAIENIVKDINTFEILPTDMRGDISLPALLGLRDRAEQNIQDLLAAVRPQSSSGPAIPWKKMIEGTAQEISATITEIGRTFYIPRIAKAQGQPPTIHVGTRPSRAPWTRSILGSVSESQTASTASTGRNTTQISTSSGNACKFFGSTNSMLSTDTEPYLLGMHRTWSGNGSAEPIGSPVRVSIALSMSDDSEETSGVYYPYLEIQVQAINNAIQTLLAAVCTPGRTGVADSLSEIIKIASDVINVYDSNHPTRCSQTQFDAIRGLREHMKKLKTFEALPEVEKQGESWQIVARSSFAIMAAMNDLTKPQ